MKLELRKVLILINLISGKHAERKKGKEKTKKKKKKRKKEKKRKNVTV